MTRLPWVRGAAILLLFLSFQATAQDDSLVSVLTNELDVSSAQASSRLRAFDSSLGDLAGLAASFEELDMDPEMLEDFLSVVYDYVDSESGERAAELMDDLF